MSIILSVIVFIIVIVIHELAHGYTAYLMGDSTAKNAGRLTLNPMAHADPVGTILLPILLMAIKSPVVFGWAKPVPVDFRNFRNPRVGMFLTSLAGPVANFLLAMIFAMIFKLGHFSPHSLIWNFLLMGILISLVLGVFNLVPIPPLDGANIIFSLLPLRMYKYFFMVERFGFIALIILLYFGFFEKIILPLVSLLTNILI